MRKVAVTVALLAAACTQNNSGVDEAAVAPEPAQELTSTTTQATPTLTTTEPEPTTIPEPTTVPTTQPVPTIPAPPSPRYLQPETTTARITSSQLASIRQCESGGDYTANTGNGFYGAYQFSLSTWASVGGSGNPALASPAEQDMRAQIMIDRGRRGEWPNC